MVPHVNVVLTTHKPRMFFWLIALCPLPFGHVGSLTARLPSILAILASVALTMRLARRFYGQATGELAGAVFITTYLVWDKGRSAQTDALLCFLILAALTQFEAFRAGDAAPRPAGIAFWIAAAFATLTKGPVGLLVPLLIALVTLAADRNLSAWRRFAPVSGPLVFIAILAAWIGFVAWANDGPYSVWGAVREHVIDRAVHGMHHKQPFWYYATVLPVQLVPWSGLVPAAVVLAWRERRPGPRFLVVWAVAVVVFFSIPVEKRDLYVLPAYPAFAILVGRAVTALEAGTKAIPRALALAPHVLIQGIVVLAGLALPVYASRSGVIPVKVALAPAVILVAMGIAAIVLASSGRMRRAATATIAGTALAYVVTATLVFPALDPMKSARSFSLKLAAATAASRAAGHEVVAFDVGNLPEAFAFYSNGVYAKESSDLAVLERHFAQDARVFAVTDEEQLAALSPSVRARVVVLEHQTLASRSVVLASNR